MGDLLRLAEAAKELGVTPLTVRRYIYQGLLASVPTAGGHHRIERSEIERLRSGNRKPHETVATNPACCRRLRRLEADVATLQKQLAVMARSCAFLAEVAERNGYTPEPRPVLRHTVEVLGPGCPACDRLAELAEAVVGELHMAEVQVKRVKGLDDIVAYGPLLTPALVIEGKLVSSGIVPSKRHLAKLVQEALPTETPDTAPQGRSWFWKRK